MKQQLFVKDHWYHLTTKALYFIHIGMFCSSKGLQQLKVFWFPLGSILIFQDSLNKAQRNESLDKNDQVVFMKFIGNQHMPIQVYINFLTFHDFLIQDLYCNNEKL